MGVMSKPSILLSVGTFPPAMLAKVGKRSSMVANWYENRDNMKKGGTQESDNMSITSC